MKKIYLTILTIALGTSFNAQLNNLDLDAWTANSGYDDPDGWTTVNQVATLLGIPYPVEKISSNPSQGIAAAKMTTVDCASCPGFGAPDPLPGFIRQETAYNALATSVTFDYKYNGVSGDWGAVVVELTQWDPAGDSAIIIAQAIDTMGASMSTWTARTVQFVYTSSLTPDSIKINFVGSIGGLVQDPSFPAPQSGSELSVDAVMITAPVFASIEENQIEGNIYTANDMIHIVLNESSRSDVSIYDLTGKQVYNGFANNVNTTINTSSYDSGIYLVKVLNGNKTLVRKVVIQ
jgi:hypothetical protein